MHDLLHGIDHALTHPFYERDYYDIFIKFIGILKTEIVNETFVINDASPAQVQAILDRFLDYTRTTRFEEPSAFDLWQLYLEPWVTRKLDNGDLFLPTSTMLFFDLDIANPTTTFRLRVDTDGIRNYPLRGKVIEIDITNERIIERSIKGTPDDENPPLMTDYMIWLKHQILKNLTRLQLPEPWRNINFNDYSLIVETPFRDFTVTEQANYLEHTHRACAWINDICRSDTSRILSEVIANQRCTPDNENTECEFPFNVCFKNRYPFPVSRPEIRRAFRPWYRSLLWERMWRGDLWHYQLLLLSRDDLRELHLIEETRVVNYNGNQLELEVVGNNVNTFRGQERCTIIPFGTVFCGIRIDGTLRNVEDNRLIFQIRSQIPPVSDEALILLSSETTSQLIKSEPPSFIQRAIQRDLYNLIFIGATTLRNSLRRSVLQLLEAIFGRRILRRGRQ